MHGRLPLGIALAATLLAAPAAHAGESVTIHGRVAEHRARFSIDRLQDRTVVSAIVRHGSWRGRVDADGIEEAERRGATLLVTHVGGHSRGGRAVLVVTLGDGTVGASTRGTSSKHAPHRPAPPPLAAPSADGTRADAPSPPAATAPTADPTPSAQATLLPPHARILSDADAAGHVRRSGWEPRPENGTANGTVPTAGQLADYHAHADDWGECDSYRDHVTGDFTGTTDEIIQWAAWKWGLDEDVVRAEAALETRWRQSFVGDDGESFGLLQVRRKYHGGTYPLARDSTAFNLDYYGALIRSYYDGCATWLGDVDHGQPYAAGDIWGAIGAWYAGRWHTEAADRYVAQVRSYLDNRAWESPQFADDDPGHGHDG